MAAAAVSLTEDNGVTIRFKRRVAETAPTCASARRVKVAYSGATVGSEGHAGGVFDSSQGYAVWFDLAPGKLVDGFEKGLRAMRVGEEAVITMTSAYGYGDKAGLEGIPPGSTLSFTVHVQEAEVPGAPGSKEARQEAAAAAKAASDAEQARRAEKQAEIEKRKAAAAARATDKGGDKGGPGGGKGGKPGAGGKGGGKKQ